MTNIRILVVKTDGTSKTMFGSIHNGKPRIVSSFNTETPSSLYEISVGDILKLDSGVEIEVKGVILKKSVDRYYKYHIQTNDQNPNHYL